MAAELLFEQSNNEITVWSLKTLTNVCNNKFDCLVHEMLLIRELTPSLKGAASSIFTVPLSSKSHICIDGNVKIVGLLTIAL